MDAKVTFSMQWAKYLHAEARRKGREVLWINLDESNISVVQRCTYGNKKIIPRKPYSLVHPHIKVSNSTEEKATFTYVGMICSDKDVQEVLPQVIFVGKKHISWAQMQLLWNNLPNNVFIRRNPGKGWTNKTQHLEIIKILGKVLEPYLGQCQPVLIFDALKLHLDAEVLEELFYGLMWYLVIPKEFTHMLQPLDTHCFRKLKHYLRIRYNDRLGTLPHRRGIIIMVTLLVEAIENVVLQED